MTSVTHFWISCGVMSIGAKRSSEEGFGGIGVVSFLVSGDEVGGRCEESGCKLVSRENGEVMVDVVLSEEECVSWREIVESL
jgi:hypothetical protein